MRYDSRTHFLRPLWASDSMELRSASCAIARYDTVGRHSATLWEVYKGTNKVDVSEPAPLERQIKADKLQVRT